ncbi:MAG: hypothetical protein Q8M54_10300 [Desulfobaccales bacterium]|nr:hypothetical protein [Desulfobaccales bacterium]
MKPRPAINPGSLIWSGEHWLNYIGNPSKEKHFGMVSLYLTRYSPAGEGHVAFVHIVSEKTLKAICSDNPKVAAFIYHHMIKGKVKFFDQDLPLVEARFRREGDIREVPGWVIETPEDRITATWLALQPPLVVEGFAPVFSEKYDFFTVLFFAEDASLSLNGRPLPGKPYLRNIWHRSIGGDRSSCVIALAETMIEVQGH